MIPRSGYCRLLTVLFVSLLLTALGCESTPHALDTASTRPWTAYAAEVQELRQTIDYLASDQLEGRGVGTHGLAAAQPQDHGSQQTHRS